MDHRRIDADQQGGGLQDSRGIQKVAGAIEDRAKLRELAGARTQLETHDFATCSLPEQPCELARSVHWQRSDSVSAVGWASRPYEADDRRGRDRGLLAAGRQIRD